MYIDAHDIYPPYFHQYVNVELNDIWFFMLFVPSYYRVWTSKFNKFSSDTSVTEDGLKSVWNFINNINGKGEVIFFQTIFKSCTFVIAYSNIPITYNFFCVYGIVKLKCFEKFLCHEKIVSHNSVQVRALHLGLS